MILGLEIGLILILKLYCFLLNQKVLYQCPKEHLILVVQLGVQVLFGLDLLQYRQELFICIQFSEVFAYLIHALAKARPQLFATLLLTPSKLPVHELSWIDDFTAFIGNLVDQLEGEKRVCICEIEVREDLLFNLESTVSNCSGSSTANYFR